MLQNDHPNWAQNHTLQQMYRRFPNPGFDHNFQQKRIGAAMIKEVRHIMASSIKDARCKSSSSQGPNPQLNRLKKYRVPTLGDVEGT